MLTRVRGLTTAGLGLRLVLGLLRLGVLLAVGMLPRADALVIALRGRGTAACRADCWSELALVALARACGH